MENDNQKVLLKEKPRKHSLYDWQPNYHKFRPLVLNLKPGDKGKAFAIVDHIKIEQDCIKLDEYYDLSQPGEYELTFHTRIYHEDEDKQIGEYPKPCTIRFTIEEPKEQP